MAKWCISSCDGNPRKQNDQRVGPYFGRPRARSGLLYERGDSHRIYVLTVTVPFPLPRSLSR